MLFIYLIIFLVTCLDVKEDIYSAIHYSRIEKYLLYTLKGMYISHFIHLEMRWILLVISKWPVKGTPFLDGWNVHHTSFLRCMSSIDHRSINYILIPNTYDDVTRVFFFWDYFFYFIFYLLSLCFFTLSSSSLSTFLFFS